MSMKTIEEIKTMLFRQKKEEVHDARLRLLRRMQGMLYHPERSKVMDADTFDKVTSAVYAIRSCTPVTEEDLSEYGRQGAKDLEVRWSEEKGRYLFGLRTREGGG